MKSSLNKKKPVTKTAAKLDNLLPKCILCREVPERGIADGFVLIGQFICSGCEQKLLTLDYNDPLYAMMVQTLKDVIYGSGKKSLIKEVMNKD
jgi:hypothetical protein